MTPASSAGRLGAQLLRRLGGGRGAGGTRQGRPSDFGTEAGPRYADVERVDVTEIPLQELKPARHGFPSFGVFYER